MKAATPVVTRNAQFISSWRRERRSRAAIFIVVIALLSILAGVVLSSRSDSSEPRNATPTTPEARDVTFEPNTQSTITCSGGAGPSHENDGNDADRIVDKCRSTGWLPTALPLRSLPLLVNATIETRWPDRRPSAPFVTGDGFRASARFIFDETTVATYHALTAAFESIASSTGDQPTGADLSAWGLTEALTAVGCPPRVEPFPVGDSVSDERQWWEKRSQIAQTLSAAAVQLRSLSTDSPSKTESPLRAVVLAALASTSKGQGAAVEYIRAVAPFVSFHCLEEGDTVFVQTDHVDEFATAVLARAGSHAVAHPTGVRYLPSGWGRLPAAASNKHQRQKPRDEFDSGVPSPGSLRPTAASEEAVTVASYWHHPTFSLITHNGDVSAPSEKDGNDRGVERPAEASNYARQREQILESRRVRRWFAQNWVLDPAREQAWLRASGGVSNASLFTKGRPIPIGLENRYNKQGRFVAVYADILGLSAAPPSTDTTVAGGRPSRAEAGQDGADLAPPTSRAVDSRPLTAFHVGSNRKDRAPAQAAMQNNFAPDWHPLHAASDFLSSQYKSWVFGKEAKQRLRLAQYLRRVSRSAYTMAPRGNGVDCHRTWESLYAGSVPIVRRGAMDPRLLALLPVALVGRRDSADWLHAHEAMDETAYAAVTKEWVRGTWARLCQRPVVVGATSPQQQRRRGLVPPPGPPPSIGGATATSVCSDSSAHRPDDVDRDTGVGTAVRDNVVVSRRDAFGAAWAAIERQWDPTSTAASDPEVGAMHPALLDMSFWAWAIQQ
jgi:hypothetical protein